MQKLRNAGILIEEDEDMNVSDYDRWFISTDGTDTAILCKREKFIDHLKDVFGAA